MILLIDEEKVFDKVQYPFLIIKRKKKKKKETSTGHLGGSVIEHLPLAQVVIPGSWDQVPHRAPCMEPASPSAYVSASLSVCLLGLNKIFKNKSKKIKYSI